MTASADGLRQMLPRQMNSTPLPVPDADMVTWACRGWGLEEKGVVHADTKGE